MIMDLKVKNATVTVDVCDSTLVVRKVKGRRNFTDWDVSAAHHRHVVDAAVAASTCPCGKSSDADLVSEGAFRHNVSILCRACGQRRDVGTFRYLPIVMPTT